MGSKLHNAPAELQNKLPAEVNNVIDALQSGHLDIQTGNYLKNAFYAASHTVYGAMTVIAFLTFVVLMFLPAKYPVAQGEESN